MTVILFTKMQIARNNNIVDIFYIPELCCVAFNKNTIEDVLTTIRLRHVCKQFDDNMTHAGFPLGICMDISKSVIPNNTGITGNYGTWYTVPLIVFSAISLKIQDRRFTEPMFWYNDIPNPDFMIRPIPFSPKREFIYTPFRLLFPGKSILLTLDSLFGPCIYYAIESALRYNQQWFIDGMLKDPKHWELNSDGTQCLIQEFALQNDSFDIILTHKFIFNFTNRGQFIHAMIQHKCFNLIRETLKNVKLFGQTHRKMIQEILKSWVSYHYESYDPIEIKRLMEIFCGIGKRARENDTIKGEPPLKQARIEE